MFVSFQISGLQRSFSSIWILLLSFHREKFCLSSKKHKKWRKESEIPKIFQPKNWECLFKIRKYKKIFHKLIIDKRGFIHFFQFLFQFCIFNKVFHQFKHYNFIFSEWKFVCHLKSIKNEILRVKFLEKFEKKDLEFSLKKKYIEEDFS